MTAKRNLKRRVRERQARTGESYVSVSRKHAAVIQRDAVYYIKDVGSTNGILYRGMRIDNKRIDEGDVFLIGDHELRFTFRVAADG